VQRWSVEWVVLCVGCSVPGLASCGCLALRMLVDHFSHESQDAPYDVPYYYLARLGWGQAPADLLYALNELGGIPSLELPHYAQK
jgi:hypothetical protein